MEFLTNTIWGGLIEMVLGFISLLFVFIPKSGRGLTGANIKLFAGGIGFVCWD